MAGESQTDDGEGEYNLDLEKALLETLQDAAMSLDYALKQFQKVRMGYWQERARNQVFQAHIRAVRAYQFFQRRPKPNDEKSVIPIAPAAE